MSIPAPLTGLLAAVFAAAAALCVVSLWRRRARHERATAAAEANHVVMSVGMVLMVLPATMDVVPPAAGAVAFGVVGLAWGVRLVALRARGRALGSAIGADRCAAHPTHLLLSNAAMVVMYALMVPSGGAAAGGHAGHAGHGGAAAGATPLALQAVGVALALYLLVHTALTVAVLVRSSPAVVAVGGGGPAGPMARVGRVVDAPAVQLGCQAVTGAGMALMLLLH
ncbi:DUF5134 domain-containing protein [Actinomycetospora straminea]|uniref:DUF5134 domain-containing protein n=1 Tax=Actinomycetospora straminea TaxID=663607 RepID=A0ABP9E1Q8_9PSEU|nr:DUF5134 domain-containing protein [Actinomycetospora straminea]MDD7931095.1 DUF5134 domain-containing protein [Actinomycetospora straminea]